MTEGAWPAHGRTIVPWHPLGRGGAREDRELRFYEASIPPEISTLRVSVSPELVADLDEATRSITRLDATHASVLAPLAFILLRTESVASSKIELIEASVDDYLRAEHGVKANEVGTAMVAGTQAISSLVGSVDPESTLGLDPILHAHRTLVGTDPREQPGQLRLVQNWIGGSNYAPRQAMYVPPPPERLPAAMADLLRFIERWDIAALIQAAIAHAQFESIHPFVDGNGRIGRALVNTVLRRRGATTTVVVPIASALVAHRDRYFDDLSAYRDGDIEPIVRSFLRSSEVAATEASETARRLDGMLERMIEQVGGVRRGSAVATLLEVLPTRPAVSVDEVVDLAEVTPQNAYAAIDRLVERGVLRPLTKRQRNQVWGTVMIMDELEDLGLRIAGRARRG